MRRTRLLMLEITIWTLGAYLLLCNLANPPRKNFIRLWDETSIPETLLGEAESPYTSEAKPQYLRWQLARPDWRDHRGGGPVMVNVWSGHATRVDILRTTLWLASILITTTVLALIPRLLRRRLPPRTGFPIQPNPILHSSGQ